MGKIAVVTGANQGLGFAIAEALCKRLDPGSSVYLTARSSDRGEDAVRELREKGLSPIFHRLDVTEDGSVSALAGTIRRRHGGVDIVISNAAARISPEVPQAEQAATFIDTNNHGAYRMIKAFAPLLREKGRFIVVASSFGILKNIAEVRHGDFDVEKRSLEDIERLMDDYVRAVENGRAAEDDWPEWINIPSKVAQVASVKILAREMRQVAADRGIMINALCPGLVDTAASRPWFEDMSEAQTPEEAAVDALWLATLPEWRGDLYGELIQHRKVVEWI